MRRLSLIFFLLVPICCGQASQELDALTDAFFAPDLSSLANHLPLELADELRSAPQAVQEAFSKQLWQTRSEILRAAKIERLPGGTGFSINVQVDPNSSDPRPIEIVLEKHMYNSNESLLRFRIVGIDSTEKTTVTVWMKSEEGSWRIYSIESPEGSINLDDKKLLSKFTSSVAMAEEASAIGSLRTLNTALVTYASTYPQIGWPPDLSSLAGTSDFSSRGAGLIDNQLGTPPYEKSGYRFTYSVFGSSPDTQSYCITAYPINHRDGSAKFFTDKNGVIRITHEDRNATEEDTALE